ncbi:DNA-binding transcriptional repressor AcrR [compost metagenome]
MPQTKRQEQKEFTRQRIMDTAFRIYSISGFSTPTNIIAQEAGISHGAIFVHFPTKEVLQLHVLERFAKEVWDKLHGLSTTSKDISELLYAHISILQKYEAFYQKIILEIASLPNETREILISLQSTMSWHFSNVIEQSQKAELIKKIPLHMLFNTWIALLHYYLQNADLFAPDTSVLNCCRDELVNTFVTLISK